MIIGPNPAPPRDTASRTCGCPIPSTNSAKRAAVSSRSLVVAARNCLPSRASRLAASAAGNDPFDALGVDKTRILAHDLGAVYAMMLGLEDPERVHSLVALSIPHPFLRFSLRFLPVFKNAWSDPLLAVPGMASLLMGRGDQALARYMFRHFVHDPGIWDQGQVEGYLARLREPGRATALGALYRQCVMPIFIKLIRGGYLDQRLRVPTLLAIGEHDEAMSESMLAGYEPYADALELARIPGAAHYVVDEQPAAVLAMAREFFARPGH